MSKLPTTTALNKLIDLKNYLWTNKKELLLIVLVIWALGSIVYLYNKSQETPRIIESIQYQIPPDYESTKNQVVNLDKKNKDLQDALDYFKNTKQQVKYITKVETKLVGQTASFPTLPSSFKYKLNNEIPVCNFEVAGDKYTYTTYDLKIKTYTLISDNEALVKVGITSSDDNIEHIIKSVNITSYEAFVKHKAFNPNILLGMSYDNKFQFNGLIGLSLFETTSQSWSFLEPNILFSNSFYFGLTPVRYNLGKPIPLINNLWVGLGYQTDLKSNMINLSLGVRL